MAYTSEIEKLERRWAENPKGRNFAPLADAYRKAGELDKALELCKSGLELHPDYVSAHIVYGRCLIDQKNDADASEVFRKVLALDHENVLALKILGEIAERGGRFDEVVEWLGRLLAVDPMNGDAAEALARAKIKAARAGMSATAPTPAISMPAPDPLVRMVPETAPLQRPSRAATPGPTRAASPTPPSAPALPDFVIDHASEEPTSPDLQAKGAPADIETFDGTLDFNAAAHGTARADGLEVQEEVELRAQDLVVEGLARTQYESGVFASPSDAPESEDDMPKIDLPLIMPDDLDEAPPAPPAPAAPAAPPAPAVPALAARRADVAASPAPPRPPLPPAPPPFPTPAAVALSDDDGAADTAAFSRAEPMLTETMAELYLRQGHQEEALRVYQALLAKRPADLRLQARVDALTPGRMSRDRQRTAGESARGETVQVFLKRILAGRPRTPALEAAPEEAGSPLDAAFRIAPSAVEPAPEVVSPGEATRPASDSISLDQVFGDEGPGSSIPPASAPRAQDASPAAQSPAPQQSGGFSFDQFFSSAEPGARTGGGVPGASEAAGGSGGGATPQGPTRGSGGKPRLPVEDEGDLDQFQAWLKGLKS